MITQSKALNLFQYESGALFWKSSGKKAGALRKNGYVFITHKGVSTGMHRIIFAMHHGYLPEMVDHIDGDVANNCIENLRAATRAQNGMNSKCKTNISTGVRNVYKDKNKFAVRLKVDGKLKSFGNYENLEFAELVADEARSKFYGQFAYESLRKRVAQLEKGN